MRKELDKVLTDLASVRPMLVVVVCDVGKFPIFRAAHPDRFFNVGVSEANAVGIAAGLASEGREVFLFSIAGFMHYRAFEQLKFSIGYWNQSVCLIGTGMGWRYHQIGRGHHAPDDIVLARLIPNMRVLTPVQPSDLRELLLTEIYCPTYIRLGQKKSDTDINDLPTIGQDIVVVSMGEATTLCSRAIRSLRAQGIDAALLGIKQFDVGTIQETLSVVPKKAKLIAVEDHIAIGGLGSLIREAGFPLHDHVHLPINVEAITRSEEKLLRQYGFDFESLTQRFLQSHRECSLGGYKG